MSEESVSDTRNADVIRHNQQLANLRTSYLLVDQEIISRYSSIS